MALPEAMELVLSKSLPTPAQPDACMPAPILGGGFGIVIQGQLYGQVLVAVRKTHAQARYHKGIFGRSAVFFEAQRRQHAQYKL